MKKKKSKAPVIILIIIITICALGVIAVFLIPEFFPESQYDKLMRSAEESEQKEMSKAYEELFEKRLEQASIEIETQESQKQANKDKIARERRTKNFIIQMEKGRKNLSAFKGKYRSRT